MRVKINEGINLTVVPSTQFKTTRISVHFVTPLRAGEIAKRTLLTSLLEMNSADYPTQSLMAAKLEEMYGASFGIGVNRFGNLHRISASIRILADRYTDRPLLPEAVQFLSDVLLRPNMHDGAFDAATFERERTNLGMYLDSMTDDKANQASLELQKAFFSDPAQAQPSFGQAADLEGLTPVALAATYHDVIDRDQIEIIVLGDVDTEQVQSLFSKLALPARGNDTLKVAYNQDVRAEVTTIVDTEELNQSKLNLGYHIDADYFGAKYYAAAVAIELFGGSPLSLLFKNVREKASLAYYASASGNMMRHFMMVQTGIDGANSDRVQELIAEQLAAVVAGDFSDELFKSIKDGMINDRRAALDSPQFLTEQALTNALLPAAKLDSHAELERIAGVTKVEVQEAAAAMKLQAVYLIKGEDN